MDKEIRQSLVRGLVGERIELYQRSATFHAQIDLLAEVVPLMVDGLAAKAEETDAEMERQVEAIKAGPFLGFGFDPQEGESE